jgi:sterol desaturase/sphingolipid hydroxylase (fatty acid hydroxylase superfamily)
MKIHGILHQFPKEIKTVILIFIAVLSIGFYGGISFVNNTTSLNSTGIETHYLGNENDENAEIMKFKKNEREILTVIHGHILSMSVIFFLLALILATTSINKKLKYFLMFEPFLSVVITFGGIYFLWLGITWFKYVIIISGTFMTLSFLLATLSIGYQILSNKK